MIAGGAKTLTVAGAPVVIFETWDLAAVGGALRSLGYDIRRLRYTLGEGLQLPDADAPFDDIFKDYEAPNYIAAKDPAVFRSVVERASRGRSSLAPLLGRI